MYESLLKHTAEYQKISASLATPGPGLFAGLRTAGRGPPGAGRTAPPGRGRRGRPLSSDIQGCFSGALRTWWTSFLMWLNLSVTADAVPPPLSRGGFGIPENFISSPEAPLGRGAVERSETERLRQAEPYPLYLLCARPSLPSMMSFAAAAMSGQRSARALASSGGNLPSTQSAKS